MGEPPTVNMFDQKSAGLQHHSQQRDVILAQPSADSTSDINTSLKDLLIKDDYSIETLMKQAREKNLSLRELRDQLLKHQQNLNQASIELFNNSYDRFFKLSHLITCLHEPIKHVIHPIEVYQRKLVDLCCQHDAYLTQIDEKISQLEETNKNKQMAAKLISLVKRRDRLFGQISRAEWLNKPCYELIVRQSNHQNIDHKVNCDSLERLAVELYHLDCEIKSIEPTNDELVPIRQSLLTSVGSKRQTLAAWFCEMIHEAMRAHSITMIDYVLQIYKQIGNDHSNLNLHKYFDEILEQTMSKLDMYLTQQPLSEMIEPSEPVLDNSVRSQFKIKICLSVYDLVTKCWSPEIYLEALDSYFCEIAWSVLTKFANWLSKLRLSDFKITGPSANPNVVPGSKSITNFLDKQDAIMRLLIEDCTRLVDFIEIYAQNELPELDRKQSDLRQTSLRNSVDAVKAGLTNVKSLQNLLER